MTTEPGKRLTKEDLGEAYEYFYEDDDVTQGVLEDVFDHIAALEAEILELRESQGKSLWEIKAAVFETKLLLAQSALSASQARAEKAEATLRDALVVLAGCKVGTPAEGFIAAPIDELG